MKLSLSLLTLAATPIVHANVYTQAVETLKNAPAEIKAVTDAAPSTYDFNSRFTRSSSVKYTGQVIRNILMEDIKDRMNSYKTGSYPGSAADAKKMLMSYYDYKTVLPADRNVSGAISGDSEFLIKAKDLNDQQMPLYEFFYSEIDGTNKDLRGKIAGVDNPLRRGKLYGWKGANTPDELMNLWFEAYANNAANGKAFTPPNGSLPTNPVDLASVTADGVDYAQLVQKFLYGAVAYSQAARDYLSTDLGPNKGLNADNNEPQKPGVNYTAMEHFWDEGFGYLGAARDALSYDDMDAFQKRSIDTNNDGLISLLDEKIVGSARNVPRLDVTAIDGDLDLSKEIMEAFIKGRQLIATRPANYKTYVEAYAQVALTVWEKSFAGVTIHYINKTLKQYKAYGTRGYDFLSWAKFWGEMKGYALVFQFNPKALMPDATFDQLHVLMDDKPVLPHAPKAQVDAYVAKLTEARDMIGKTYGFSQNNVINW